MAKKTFETALKRLETIAEELESGELTLENSLKKFDEGMALVEFCTARLNEARARVELIVNKEQPSNTVSFSDPTSYNQQTTD